MDVLRHWIAYPRDGKPEVVSLAAAADVYRDSEGWHVSGPFVLEANCRGAVEAVEYLREWIDTEGRNCPSTTTIDALLKRRRARWGAVRP
jgi:hypothetical protein